MIFTEIIRKWYENNKRALPWRETRDPYLIWLSEIILQQTRVDQGLAYYRRFSKAFPDVKALAVAHEDEVLGLWQGLGYYSRARNLHAAAQEIVEKHAGIVPQTYTELLTLKGVGPYTAAAVASICFGEARAVVDGNVARVLSRVFGIALPVDTPAGHRAIVERADKLLDRRDPGTHNQALMEFGALQCTPRQPACGDCPLEKTCLAHKGRLTAQLPQKKGKRQQRHRWLNFYILYRSGHVLIGKREGGDIWQGLYQFPLLESASPGVDPIALLKPEPGRNTTAFPCWPPPERSEIRHISGEIRHELTHQRLHLRFIHIETPHGCTRLSSGWQWISLACIDDYPLPQPIKRYMEVAKF